MLDAARPLGADRDVRVYDGRQVPGIDSDRIIYFAISIFWRGAAHEWNESQDLAADGAPVNITLGTRLESLRKCLLDEEPFPESVHLLTWVESARDAKNNMHLVPPFKAFDLGHEIYRSYIPGLIFTLWVGENVNGEIRRTCTARTGVLAVTSSAPLREAETDARVQESERKGKLAREK